MNLPISTSSTTGLLLAALFGLLFGLLLHKGGVANYNVIVNFFRLRDFTMLKVMLAAVTVGAVGIFAGMQLGWLSGYHIKNANMLGVILGGGLFGIGMVLYGYCPGTGVAAIATGSLHALVGFFGMLAGGIAYAFAYPWLTTNVLNVGALGKVRLPDVTPLPDAAWVLILIAAFSALVFALAKYAPAKSDPAG